MINNNQPKNKAGKFLFPIMFGLVTALAIYFTLSNLNIIPDKKSSDPDLWWIPTIFCYVVGVPGLILSITALIKEKIAKKRFKEKEMNEEDYIPEEIMVFKNAIPELKHKTQLDVDDKPMEKYIFKQVKRSIIKYQLFNQDNKLIYDSYKLNKTFFVPLKISFNNHISNKSFNHIIGRTLVGNGYKNTYFAPMFNSFRVDGLTIDDYCEMLNIQMYSTGTNQYDIRYKNALIGNIKWIATKRIIMPSNKVDPIEISCIEDYLDIVFFLCFAIGFCGRDIPTKNDIRGYSRM